MLPCFRIRAQALYCLLRKGRVSVPEGLNIRRHTVHLVLLMYLIGFSHYSGNSSRQLHIEYCNNEKRDRNARDGRQNDDSHLPRDIDIPSDDEEESTESLLWVPYAHFGI